jgi:hypothetical protein
LEVQLKDAKNRYTQETQKLQNNLNVEKKRRLQIQEDKIDRTG